MMSVVGGFEGLNGGLRRSMEKSRVLDGFGKSVEKS